MLAAYPDPSIQLDEAKRLEIRERIIRIRETYDKYDRIQTDIDILTNDEQETVEYRERVEEDYFRLIDQAESLLARGRMTVNSNTHLNAATEEAHYSQTATPLQTTDDDGPSKPKHYI